MNNAGYTRRQELVCDLAELEMFSSVVLYENEVLHVRQSDNSYRSKMGDGITPLKDLPYMMKDTQVTSEPGYSTSIAASQALATNIVANVEENLRGTQDAVTFLEIENNRLASKIKRLEGTLIEYKAVETLAYSIKVPSNSGYRCNLRVLGFPSVGGTNLLQTTTGSLNANYPEGLEKHLAKLPKGLYRISMNISWTPEEINEKPSGSDFGYIVTVPVFADRQEYALNEGANSLDLTLDMYTDIYLYFPAAALGYVSIKYDNIMINKGHYTLPFMKPTPAYNIVPTSIKTYTMEAHTTLNLPDLSEYQDYMDSVDADRYNYIDFNTKTLNLCVASRVIEAQDISLAGQKNNLVYYKFPKSTDDMTYDTYSRPFGFSLTGFDCVWKGSPFDDVKHIGSCVSNATPLDYWVGLPIGTDLDTAKQLLTGCVLRYTKKTMSTIDISHKLNTLDPYYEEGIFLLPVTPIMYVTFENEFFLPSSSIINYALLP